ELVGWVRPGGAGRSPTVREAWWGFRSLRDLDPPYDRSEGGEGVGQGRDDPLEVPREPQEPELDGRHGVVRVRLPPRPVVDLGEAGADRLAHRLQVFAGLGEDDQLRPEHPPRVRAPEDRPGRAQPEPHRAPLLPAPRAVP